jgi:lysophospholipase L1-like esterase
MRHRFTWRRPLLSFAIALALVGAGAAAHANEHAKPALRVLPLGDSITAGIIDGGKPGSGGYRALLQELLAEHQDNAILVGTRNDLSPKLADPWHDGWPGYVIRATSPGAPGQLYGPLAEQVIRQTRPDVILLMVGTNDFLRYEAAHGTYSVNVMVQSMNLLLREIYAVSPHVRVIVGAIVDSPRVDACYVERFDTGTSSCDAQVHPSLAGLVRAYSAKGYAIDYASDLMNAIPRDEKHFPDGIHPANGTGGYDAIARIWYRALTKNVFVAPVQMANAKPAAPVRP